MEVKLYGLKSFIVEDGVVRIFCHIEGYQGLKKLFIDMIDVQGTIEITELAVILRKIKQFFRNNYGVNY